MPRALALALMVLAGCGPAVVGGLGTSTGSESGSSASSTGATASSAGGSTGSSASSGSSGAATGSSSASSGSGSTASASSSSSSSATSSSSSTGSSSSSSSGASSSSSSSSGNSSSSGSSTTGGAVQVRFASFNVQHAGKGTDGVTNPGRQVDALLQKAFPGGEPDIVCLVEAHSGNGATDSTYSTPFDQKTGESWTTPYFGVSNYQGTKAVDGVEIATRFPIVSSAVHPFPLHAPYPSCAQDYGFGSAVVDVNGTHVNVLCAHLYVNYGNCRTSPGGGGSGSDQSIRNDEAQDLLAYAATLSGPTIIAGDFNAWPDEPAIATLSGAMTDAVKQAKRDGTYSTYADNTVPDNHEHATDRTRKGRVDYVFLGSGVALEGAGIPDLRDFSTTPADVTEKYAGCTDYASGNYQYPEDCFVRPSDHNMVTATLGVGP